MSENTLRTSCLDLGSGDRRIWRVESTRGLVVRPLRGYGPKHSYPIGYITADDDVVTETFAALSSAEIRFLKVFYSSSPTGLTETGELTPAGREVAWSAGARCRLCEIPSGLPHAGSCRHRGKNVGDKVN